MVEHLVAIGVPTSVLDALALDDAERTHLFDLAADSGLTIFTCTAEPGSRDDEACSSSAAGPPRPTKPTPHARRPTPHDHRPGPYAGFWLCE